MKYESLFLATACLLGTTALAVDGTDSPAVTHSFLATGGKTFIWQVDADAKEGHVVWEYSSGTREA